MKQKRRARLEQTGHMPQAAVWGDMPHMSLAPSRTRHSAGWDTRSYARERFTATSHIRFLALVIQLALVSSLFAACGGDDDDTASTGGKVAPARAARAPAAPLARLPAARAPAASSGKSSGGSGTGGSSAGESARQARGSRLVAAARVRVKPAPVRPGAPAGSGEGGAGGAGSSAISEACSSCLTD